MDKLQYDSFYKFMVSAGVVLVAAPLIGLYYLLCNGNQILISQIEYDALSTTSMQFVLERDQTILWVLRFLPWVLGFLLLCGLICLIYGGIKWHGIQNELDEQTKLKTREQKYNVDKLTASEVVAKVFDETVDEHEAQSEVVSQTTAAKTHVTKALEIEDLCCSYLRRQNSVAYSVQQNVRIKDYAGDILAVSKFDRHDYLYEVKYWTNTPSTYIVGRVAKRLEDMRVEYERMAKRKCTCILMIVTVEQLKDKIIQICNGFSEMNSMPLDIQVHTEGDLK